MNGTVDQATATDRVAAARIHPSGGDHARRLPLRANFSWTLAGNVLYSASQWGILIALAKFGNVEMVGVFALGLAISAPIFMFANLNLRAIEATDARHMFPFGVYLALRLGATAVALGAVCIAALATGQRDETLAVVLIVGVAKAFEALSDIYLGALQQHERMDRFALSLALKGAASLAALAVGLLLTGSIAWATAAWAGTWLLVLVFFDMPNARAIVPTTEHRPRWQIGPLCRLTWQALPLGVVMLLTSLNTNIPRYVIENHYSTRELGIFAGLSYILVAGNTVVGALGQSASPRLARLAAGNHRAEFRNLLLKLVAVALLIGIFGILASAVAGGPLLTLVYRAEYGAQVATFVWLMAAAALFYVASFLGVAMTALRHLRIQAPLFLCVTAATLAASLVLIPRFGLLGAAWSVCSATALQLAGSIVIVVRALRREPEASRDAVMAGEGKAGGW